MMDQGEPDKINSQEVARLQNFVMGNDETELEFFVESRSFVNRVNDQVRKRQKGISKVAGNGEEHSMICGMFMAGTMESAVFIGKNFQNNHNSIMNTADLTLKQMFDISAKLVTEQNEISGLETIGWEKHSWKYLSLIGDERIINLSTHKNLRLFRFCNCVLGKSIRILNLTKLGKKDRMDYIFSKATNTLTESMESRRNSSGTSSQHSIRCNSVIKSKIY